MKPKMWYIKYKELINDVFELERKLFMKMDIYLLIKQKCNTNCLTPIEIKQLNIDISHVFVRQIRILKKSCQSLTNEDVMFCCLKKLGFDNLVAGRSMGIASRQAINQRKYRIRKKMNADGCKYLFDMIFLSDV